MPQDIHSGMPGEYAGPRPTFPMGGRRVALMLRTNVMPGDKTITRQTFHAPTQCRARPSVPGTIDD